MSTTLFSTPGVSHEPPVERTRPLRVCHVSLTLKTGGLERLLVDFARRHDRDDVSLEFLAMRELGPFAEAIAETGCPVAKLESWKRLPQMRELVERFRAGKFDVVHTHNTYPHLYATLAARWAGVPIVVNTRHGQRLGHNWKANLQYRWTSRLVDRVIAVSDDAARLCLQEDRLPNRLVTRIWNGIDLEQFPWQGSSGDLTAVTVSRLSAEKDIPTMLRAVPHVRAEFPQFRLNIVGDGSERTTLEQLTDELQLRDAVTFLGEQRDVPRHLTAAGFYVSSSLSEGISLTLLEAMAAGLPVVATAVGGNPEIVLPGVTGALCPAADPLALAEQMKEMCRQRTDWLAMGAAGRQRVAQHFTIQRMLDDYTALYRRIRQQKQRGSRGRTANLVRETQGA